MAITIKHLCAQCGREIHEKEEVVHTCTAGLLTLKEELCPQCLMLQVNAGPEPEKDRAG